MGRSRNRGIVRTALLSGLLGLPLALGWGCGGDTSGGSHPVSRSGFPDALARTICQNIGPCCQSANRPFDAGKCETVLSQVYQAVLPDGDGGTYDPAAAGSCIDAVGAAVRTCGAGDPSGSTSCDGLFGRTSAHGKAGDPCESTCTQSGSSLSCFSFGPSSDAGAGTSCYTNDGLFCDMDRHACTAQVALGSPCSGSGTCATGWCNAGTCVPPSSAGQSCNEDAACVSGLFCDFATSTCLQAKPDGASCTGDSECQNGNCSNDTCGPRNINAMLDLACAG